jgi:hypothetical protein
MMTALEPWCNTLYTDDEMGVLEASYYELEQPHTSFDLKSKLKITKHTIPTNNIVVEFNAKHFTQDSFNIIQQLPNIIADSGEVGTFELDIFKITIKSLTTYEHDLIYLS